MSLELIPYELALRSPMATSHAIVAERTGSLVRLSEGGTVGWGDLCPMPGWSAHDLATLRDRVDLAGLRLEEDMVADVLGLLAAAPEARAAVAGAAADVLAQEAGLPLAAHLAPDPLERVAVNATIGAADVSTALTNVYLAIANGIETIKLKVAHRRVEEDLALVEAARRAVGDDIELRLDANGGWRPDEALEILERLAPFGVAVCEEPTAGIDEIAAVGAESPIPVAVDESARDLDDLRRALATGTIAHVVIKPQALGGPDLAMEAVGAAHAAGVTPIITSMIDSAVGVAHAVHVAAASGVTAAHGVATSALLAADVAAPLPVENGAVIVPSIPGLGVRPAAGAR
ncbi:MAG: o-succinylbenzoate synthase [Actinomycetota bacterium]